MLHVVTFVFPEKADHSRASCVLEREPEREREREREHNEHSRAYN